MEEYRGFKIGVSIGEDAGRYYGYDTSNKYITTLADTSKVNVTYNLDLFYFKTVEDVKKAIDKYHELRETKQKETKGKTMNKREAIKAMCDGKKVVGSNWSYKDEYLEMTNEGIIIAENGEPLNINDFYDEKDEWKIYNEYNLDVYEAFKAVLDGKKVQHESWKKQEFIQTDSSGDIIGEDYCGFYRWGESDYKAGWKIIK